jgi:hypothetical protein
MYATGEALAGTVSVISSVAAGTVLILIAVPPRTLARSTTYSLTFDTLLHRITTSRELAGTVVAVTDAGLGGRTVTVLLPFCAPLAHPAEESAVIV